MKRPRQASAPQDLERRLLTYAVTAGAALAAGAQDAAASPMTYLVNTTLPLDTLVPLDIDQDSVDDFVFFNASSGYFYTGFGVLYGAGLTPTNAFFGAPKGSKGGKSSGIGLTVPKGSTQWGPGGYFPPSYVVNVAALGFAKGSVGGLLVPLAYKLPTSAYYPLPLLFDIGGSTHYGWARIRAEFAGPNTLSASIRDVGWESDPDTPIHLPDPVPEPGTLGLLALGAAGLALRRRMTRSSQPE